MQVAAKLDDAVRYTLKAAQQDDAVAGELMQVNGVATLGAGDMRLAGKLWVGDGSSLTFRSYCPILASHQFASLPR